LLREIMPSFLIQLEIRWSGPSWLKHDKESWPQRALLTNMNVPERKLKVITVIAASTQEPDIFYRYSNFTRLIRVLAYIFQFVKNSKCIKGSFAHQLQEETSWRNIVQSISLNEQQQAIFCLIKAYPKPFLDEIPVNCLSQCI